MYVVSGLFSCCGYNGPNDFSAASASSCCVQPTSSTGCGNLAPSQIKQMGINYLVIPSGVILGIEFLLIVLVPILIAKIYRSTSSTS